MGDCIFKFAFHSGVHFGAGQLEDSEIVLHADTLFSALFQVALKHGNGDEKRLLNLVKSDKLKISDLFPYMNSNRYFLPKPLVYVAGNQEEVSSTVRKAYKNMKYIAEDVFEEYLQGAMPFERTDDLKNLGKSDMRTVATIRMEEETLPYRIGTYYFEEGNGLYCIAQYEEDDIYYFLSELLDELSYEGIGGKRSSGLGRFGLYQDKLPEKLEKMLGAQTDQNVTLSASLPTDEELEAVIANSRYQILKRSGFVASEHYSNAYMRKKDLYVFAAGSVFDRRYLGDVYDVSDGGSHPVYRYAKPLFIGIESKKV